MFSRLDTRLISNPVCLQRVENISPEDFQYYDKDGFELNQAEQKFYSAMGYPLDYPCLNHKCYQEPWFKLKLEGHNLILDHCIILHRACYAGNAMEQLKDLQKTIPTAGYLINTKAKWGFDFALDAVSEDGTVYEVLHIEFDSNDYEYFKTRMIMMEYTIRHTDWVDAARRVWQERSQWKYLKGFRQNDWKAEYLLGWNKCEYTEKAV